MPARIAIYARAVEATGIQNRTKTRTKNWLRATETPVDLGQDDLPASSLQGDALLRKHRKHRFSASPSQGEGRQFESWSAARDKSPCYQGFLISTLITCVAPPTESRIEEGSSSSSAKKRRTLPSSGQGELGGQRKFRLELND
jgi:hypothetical protein